MNCKFCNAEMEEGITLCPACGKENLEDLTEAAVEPAKEIADVAEETTEMTEEVAEVTEEGTEMTEETAEVTEEVAAEESEETPKKKTSQVADRAGCRGRRCYCCGVGRCHYLWYQVFCSCGRQLQCF